MYVEHRHMAKAARNSHSPLLTATAPIFDSASRSLRRVPQTRNRTAYRHKCVRRQLSSAVEWKGGGKWLTENHGLGLI